MLSSYSIYIQAGLLECFEYRSYAGYNNSSRITFPCPHMPIFGMLSGTCLASPTWGVVPEVAPSRLPHLWHYVAMTHSLARSHTHTYIHSFPALWGHECYCIYGVGFSPVSNSRTNESRKRQLSNLSCASLWCCTREMLCYKQGVMFICAPSLYR